MTGGEKRESRGGERRKGEEGEGGVGCGARRPAGARGPALAKDGPGRNPKPCSNSFCHLQIFKLLFSKTILFAYSFTVRIGARRNTSLISGLSGDIV